MINRIYTNGQYLVDNPTWYAEDSRWKAEQVFTMIKKNNLVPHSVCEAGCGVGEILRELQLKLNSRINFTGYEVSPQVFDVCKRKENEKLTFVLKDILQESDVYFDLMLLIDVLEHLEDYYDFLRRIKTKANLKIIHIPLDLSVQAILRETPLLKSRRKAGHIHFFTKSTFLFSLKELGYDIIDYFYTAGSIDLPGKSIISKLSRFPRKILFDIRPDFASRVLGGCSLMILVK